jgi:hypothetical protein
MNIQIHPTHKRHTQAGVALLSLPAVVVAVAGVVGYVSASWVLAAFAVSAVFLLPWILWRNTRCKCPQCGSWLRADRDSERPPGGPQLFRCYRCEILWDDQMERGVG